MVPVPTLVESAAAAVERMPLSPCTDPDCSELSGGGEHCHSGTLTGLWILGNSEYLLEYKARDTCFTATGRLLQHGRGYLIGRHHYWLAQGSFTQRRDVTQATAQARLANAGNPTNHAGWSAYSGL